jgi:uncharacterized protein
LLVRVAAVAALLAATIAVLKVAATSCGFVPSLGGPTQAGAAPAGTAIGKVIGSDAGLAAEDRRLAAVFAEAQREKERPIDADGVSLLDDQRKWLAGLDECASDAKAAAGPNPADRGAMD